MIIDKSTQRVSAFTLIELLVVISIISLLVSILLPSLSAARKRSSQIKCASNLKHAGSAISMYAMDFNDYFPQADASADFRWYIALPRAGYVNGSQSLMCPEAQNPKESWYGGGQYAPVSYGMNSMIGGLNSSSYPQRQFREIDTTPQGLVKTPIVMDVMDGQYIIHKNSNAGNDPYSASPPGRIAIRHISESNALFGDGHVKSIKGPFAPAGHNVWWLDPFVLYDPEYIRF